VAQLTASRPLVRLLVVLAFATFGVSSVLVFFVLPTSGRLSREAIARIGDIEHARTLLTGQSNDERGFLLGGDERFLADFETKGAELKRTVERLRRTTGPAERALLNAAADAYRRYLDEHERMVTLAREGRTEEAAALAVTTERTVRLETDDRLEAAHQRLAAESDRALRDNRRRATALTGLLLVLGFVPALGAFALGRTLRRLDEEKAAASDRRRLADAQRVARLGSWEHDLATETTTWSDELFRILGHEPGAFVPSPDAFVDTVHPEDRPAVAEVVTRGPADGVRFAFECRVACPDGTVRWTETQGEYTVADDGNPLTVFGTALDITDRHEASERISRGQAELRHRAYHDALTGLPNRALLLERLDEALGRAASVAVVILDLDSFKRINDSLGHALGDRLLVRVAERLAAGVRLESDRPTDTVARLGGDEFAILLVDVEEARAQAVIERVLAECAIPFTLDGRRFTVTASAGLALGDWSTSGAELLRDADIAMYAAKEAGRARFAVFDPAMRAAVTERLVLENELRAAVESGELALHYQPVVDTTTGSVVKVEALVRWLHPERGLVGPDRFIPLAEETGLIVPLGAWVLQEACRELARHQDRHPGLKMAVNVSARQLDEEGLVAAVTSALEQAGLTPDRLVVEVTESALPTQDDVARNTLDALEQLGVTISIDDFGTGYSSLSRLRLLPVGELKIDKSFVDELDSDDERAPVVAAVIALAHGLGRTVVAEGVETQQQLASLVRLGCDAVQGYLLSRPLPPEELAELLAFPVPFAGYLPARAEGVDEADEEVMAAVERAVGAGGDLDAAVRPLLVEVTRLTGLESAYLTGISLDEHTQEVLAAYNSGGLEVPEGSSIPWVDTLCRRALTAGPRSTDDVARDFPGHEAAAALGIHSYTMVPVTTAEGRLVGTLCAASHAPVRVDPGVVRVLEVFSRLLAEALERHGAPTVDHVRVVVVDDSPVVRGLVRRTLAADSGIEVVAEATTGEEAVAASRIHRPDVVLLDLNLPGLDGLAALPAVLEACPAAKVVVLSAQADDLRGEALAAGASAVVDKQDGVGQLRAVIAAVL
jgi:diguanylate cyclase (GGDEF)-like protein/PAS domain S-box-containing protein